jgi:hypothetical protein
VKFCADCGKPASGFAFSVGKPAPPSGYFVCPSCRGKRAGRVNREKAEKHGKDYFDRRSANARG